MIVTSHSTRNFAQKESGGKGFNLFLLSQMGVPVPEWVVLGRRYFDLFVRQPSVQEPFERVLAAYKNKTQTGAEVEKSIAQIFERGSWNAELDRAVDEALRVLGPQTVISVRSSAADEDSQTHSFAGQLSTFLYVQGREDIVRYIKLCWASGFSERGLSYRAENALELGRISVAVVLQRMIDPDTSGVLFTCDPVEKNLKHHIVSSVYGVGEGLVSGLLDADSYWLDSQTGTLHKSEIADKSQMLRRDSSGQCQKVDVPTEKRSGRSLDDATLRKLFELGRQISNTLRRPQDIEWAVKDGQFYILQTRPVTSLGQDLIGYPNLWDNSNIVESYGGLTLPLSFSFALRNYKNVYVQFCEVLGVPSEIIKDMDSYLSYMLGNLNGRVYYNLFNWYKLVGVLPGFKQNREFMETMMGVTEALSDEINERIKPHESWDTLAGRIRKFRTGLNFLYYHWTIQSMVDDFLKSFHREYDRYKAMPLRTLRGDELCRVYMELERKMLGRWKAPIINDFLCMVHFGILRKLTTKWLSGLDATIQNDLLAGEGGLESAEPTRELLRLASIAAGNPGIRRVIEETDVSETLEALNKSAFQDYYHEICSYIDRFGFRCMSEMKLEMIDLTSDPSFLFSNLKNYLRNDKTQVHDSQRERDMREKAEGLVSQHLSGFRKKIYFWVLKHARKAVKNRENTRFARTRIYGLARTMFETIGVDLQGMGVFADSRDVFWLTIEEVFGVYNGTLPSPDLATLVEMRKSSYKKFDSEEIDARIMTRGAVYWNNSFVAPATVQTETGDWDLKGTPCCPGILEGVVKVIINPGDDMELNGEILVTARTDPGWVPLYPNISGLLVERGSLLSHSAIVAREMGIPAIVSIPNLVKTLKTGMRIRMDGKAGTVHIIE